MAVYYDTILGQLRSDDAARVLTDPKIAHTAVYVRDDTTTSAHIPVLSGGTVYHYTRPLLELTIDSAVDNGIGDAVIFTCGSITSTVPTKAVSVGAYAEWRDEWFRGVLEPVDPNATGNARTFSGTIDGDCPNGCDWMTWTFSCYFDDALHKWVVSSYYPDPEHYEVTELWASATEENTTLEETKWGGFNENSFPNGHDGMTDCYVKPNGSTEVSGPPIYLPAKLGYIKAPVLDGGKSYILTVCNGIRHVVEYTPGEEDGQ